MKKSLAWVKVIDDGNDARWENGNLGVFIDGYVEPDKGEFYDVGYYKGSGNEIFLQSFKSRSQALRHARKWMRAHPGGKLEAGERR